ncbi:YebC/PmpR family DNA-binding transcriptional regulator [bacterium]|nr:YebC/PmpR family DNA-binding transcriptional regulator [bacterium]
MSGHSKWSSIKRKKAANDAKKGKVFTKITKELTMTAKNGGDPDSNPSLRAALEKAKAVNMPKDNIEKAIKKGTGELPGVIFEEISYEGYAPHGIALLIQTITDNKNRTTAAIRHLLTKYGGNLGETGCVSWNFEKKGQLFIKKEITDEDSLMEIAMEAGADDLKTEDDGYYIYCDYKDLFIVNDAIKKAGVEVDSAEITHIPQNTVKLTPEQTKKVLKFLDVLDDEEDVQNVYSNLDIPDDINLEED